MTQRYPIARLRCALLFAAAAVLAPLDASARVTEHNMHVEGFAVRYKVVLPDDYDPAKEYPGVLVFGGGPQTMETVDRALERNFRAEAEKRGYIVVAPAAPDGSLFFQGGERIFPEFLDRLVREYKIAEGKFHVAGPSNGGIAALHVAAQNPDRFLSVTAFPGYLWQPTTDKLVAFAKLCVYLYIGEHDEYRWHDEMRREAQFLRSRGAVASYTVEAGQPHRIETVAGANAGRLFDGFQAAKRGCTR
jgi:poly(3-hydroxybutyrate) depolymerase